MDITQKFLIGGCVVASAMLGAEFGYLKGATVGGAYAYKAADTEAAKVLDLRYTAAMQMFYQDKQQLEGLTILVAEANFDNPKAQAVVPAIAAACGVVMQNPVYTRDMGVAAMKVCGEKFAKQYKPQ